MDFVTVKFFSGEPSFLNKMRLMSSSDWAYRGGFLETLNGELGSRTGASSSIGGPGMWVTGLMVSVLKAAFSLNRLFSFLFE
eukprot:CAMPEP_0170498238 /NCGR_PEP_ID=MMETSP0208-20121228/27236_1 /TAXON_ID=197538 /ORGANISM="Strombidium inclinatum, Strain S3" /LENGTH=81 /DNA_ID=CAMNT_0010775357 /DNA_START=2182 /DNA_END=2427 /DNA_ORIENTATION=-